MDNKLFLPGTPVVYRPKTIDGTVYKTEYGIVKFQDGPNSAYVWYHSGCTTAHTATKDLTVTSYAPPIFANIHAGCDSCFNKEQYKLREIITKNLNREMNDNG